MGLLTNPWAWLVLAVGLSISHTAAYVKGARAEKEHQQAITATAMAAMTEQFKKEVADGNRLAQEYETERTARAQAESKFARASRARTIEVPVKQGCPPATLSLGFVRVHDCAARSDSGDSCTTARPDDSTAGDVTATQVAAAAVENYGVCFAEFEKLKALQRWVRETCK